MQKLFSCYYGSRLYGTNTAASDTDIKHIILPELNDLLLANPVKNIVKKTNMLKNVKNNASNIDEEFITIQKFAKDFLEGQSYALELCFAVDGENANQIIYNDKFRQFCHELQAKYLTSDIDKLISYAKNQALLYSKKEKRLNAAKSLLSILEKFSNENNLNYFHNQLTIEIEKLKLFQKYNDDEISMSEYDQDGQRNMQPCIKLLSRTIPLIKTVAEAKTIIKRIINKYSARATAASKQNIDWKAISHALRLINEGIALLSVHYLTFPYDAEYAMFLRNIKAGAYSYDSIKNQILDGLYTLQQLKKQSDLPSLTATLRFEYTCWLTSWLRVFYEL
jgi:hypothetical protein